MNFGKRVVVDKEKFLVLPAVIVKSALSKAELAGRLHKEVRQLASLEGANLYLLDSNDSVAEANRLAKRDDILYAQPDMVLRKTERTVQMQSTDPYADLGLDEVWKTTRGRGAKIAVIDDGFNLHHPLFSRTDVLLSYDADTMTLDASHKDVADGHGTKMASIIFASPNEQIKGVAPEASLVAIRQADMRTSHLVVALYVAHLAGADIISGSWTIPFICEPFYDTLRQFIHSGRRGRGGVALFASGNGQGVLNPVCSIEGVLCIGAATSDGTIARYTRRGSELDLLAPAPLPALSAKTGQVVRTGGTSAATAFVAGVAALMLSRDANATGDAIRSRLIDTAAPTPSGYPLVCPGRAVKTKTGVQTHE